MAVYTLTLKVRVETVSNIDYQEGAKALRARSVDIACYEHWGTELTGDPWCHLLCKTKKLANAMLVALAGKSHLTEKRYLGFYVVVVDNLDAENVLRRLRRGGYKILASRP